MLWEQLVGDATFDTALRFSLPPPPNSTSGWVPTAAPPCSHPAECVRALAFRDKTNTSVVLLLVNLHTNRTFEAKGETGRSLYYLHRKEWQLTVPSLVSDAVSLNGAALAATQKGPLPPRFSLAEGYGWRQSGADAAAAQPDVHAARAHPWVREAARGAND